MEESYRLYRKAAEQGDARGLFCVARCFDYGRGVTQNSTEAVAWYQKAADAGSAAAMCDLGVCYERGEGVERDLSRAELLLYNPHHLR